MEILIEKNAQINIKNKLGDTALILAASKGIENHMFVGVRWSFGKKPHRSSNFYKHMTFAHKHCGMSNVLIIFRLSKNCRVTHSTWSNYRYRRPTSRAGSGARYSANLLLIVSSHEARFFFILKLGSSTILDLIEGVPRRSQQGIFDLKWSRNCGSYIQRWCLFIYNWKKHVTCTQWLCTIELWVVCRLRSTNSHGW